jgi:hypothetical protein
MVFLILKYPTKSQWQNQRQKEEPPHIENKDLEKLRIKLILLFFPLLTPNSLSAMPSSILPKPIILEVRQSGGKCPKTVKIWNSFRLYEATGEHNIIAYTSEFASRPQITISSKKLVEYKAALKKEFASCYGSATYDSEDGIDLYTLRFTDNNVYFRVILPSDTDANPSSFGTVSIKDSRPFVKWAIAD